MFLCLSFRRSFGTAPLYKRVGLINRMDIVIRVTNVEDSKEDEHVE